MQQEEKLKYLKVALIVFGCVRHHFHRRNLCDDDVGMAFGLGLDATATRIRADDYRHLRYLGSFFDSGCERPVS